LILLDRFNDLIDLAKILRTQDTYSTAIKGT